MLWRSTCGFFAGQKLTSICCLELWRRASRAGWWWATSTWISFSVFPPSYGKLQKFPFIFSIKNLIFIILLLFIWFFFCNFFLKFYSYHLILFNFYTKFGPYSFNCYLFIYYLFSNWIFFSNSSLNIWFQFILVSNLINFLFITIYFVLNPF